MHHNWNRCFSDRIVLLNPEVIQTYTKNVMNFVSKGDQMQLWCKNGENYCKLHQHSVFAVKDLPCYDHQRINLSNANDYP